ncbi:Histone-Lysine N-Methyltransferase Mecom [Manis pentadactyla]|nr:Histone-Lysine N-Methyltransferase Mecom [Manis pentadactyla]
MGLTREAAPDFRFRFHWLLPPSLTSKKSSFPPQEEASPHKSVQTSPSQYAEKVSTHPELEVYLDFTAGMKHFESGRHKPIAVKNDDDKSNQEDQRGKDKSKRDNCLKVGLEILRTGASLESPTEHSLMTAKKTSLTTGLEA